MTSSITGIKNIRVYCNIGYIGLTAEEGLPVMIAYTFTPMPATQRAIPTYMKIAVSLGNLYLKTFIALIILRRALKSNKKQLKYSS